MYKRQTLNDVCLALVGTALRRLLAELDALPAEPLITMVPVNIRPKDDPGGGNAVGAILASLATHLDDPLERLATTAASTRRAKAELASLSRTAIIQYAALLMAPLSVAPVPGLGELIRPAFNVVVSNVPGPTHPLYFRGARLEANYPVSIPYHGNALNITIASYAGTLNLGFTGCRDAVPKLQRLAVYAGEAADELEAALTFLGLGVPPPTPSWGELLAQASQHELRWWLSVPAGLAITATAAALLRLARR